MRQIASGVLTLALGAVAAGCPAQQPQASAVQFVQQFYDQYLQASANEPRQAMSQLLTRKPPVFTSTLSALLNWNLRAQASSPGEQRGLDFDPFVNAQDPCDHYFARPTEGQGAHVLVNVYGICARTADSLPAVVADVVQISGRWTFSNFRYPRQHADLVALLSDLRRMSERQRNQH